MLICQAFCKMITSLILTVDYKYHLRLRREGFHPVKQAVLVCVTTDAVQLCQLGFYFDGLAKELHIFSSLSQRASQCSISLITYEEDSTLRSPQIVFQMMFDTTGFAHTGSRDDHLWCGVKVDGFRLIAGDGQMEIRKTDGADTRLDQCHSFFVKTGLKILIKNGCSLYSKRTVHVYRKIKLYQLSFFDLPDKIQHFLRAAHCKCRNNQIASPT